MNNSFWNEQQEVERLEEKINRLQRRVKQLEAESLIVSWTKNPDRMGGCYTEEEIQNSSGWS